MVVNMAKLINMSMLYLKQVAGQPEALHQHFTSGLSLALLSPPVRAITCDPTKLAAA